VATITTLIAINVTVTVTLTVFTSDAKDRLASGCG
jgi:hypothetical protein